MILKKERNNLFRGTINYLWYLSQRWGVRASAVFKYEELTYLYRIRYDNARLQR